MTKKRFHKGDWSNNICEVYDDEDYIGGVQLDCADEFIGLLNSLNKENEQLKQSYTELRHRHSLLHDECIEAECDRDSYQKDVSSLEKENEQLKQFKEKSLHEVYDLNKENEQLKERNNRQAKQLDHLYNLIEEKDWRTLTDIIDDFKQCEERLQREMRCYE